MGTRIASDELIRVYNAPRSLTRPHPPSILRACENFHGFSSVSFHQQPIQYAISAALILHSASEPRDHVWQRSPSTASKSKCRKGSTASKRQKPPTSTSLISATTHRSPSSASAACVSSK